MMLSRKALMPLSLGAMFLAVIPCRGELPDLTGDGKADRADLIKLARMADKRENPTTAADIDGDGLVTIWDVEMYASGLDMPPIRNGGGSPTGGGSGGNGQFGSLPRTPGDLVDVHRFYRVWRQPKFIQDHRYTDAAGAAKAKADGYTLQSACSFRIWRRPRPGLDPPV